MGISYATLEHAPYAQTPVEKNLDALLEQFKMPLIYLSLNLAERASSKGLLDFAFNEGMRRVLRMGDAAYCEAEGYCACFAMPMEAMALKQLCIDAEERDALGALLNLAVFDESGRRLVRTTPRICFLCPRPAKTCALESAHTAEEAAKKAEEVLVDFAARRHAQAAGEALLGEVYTTPKPGLVDRRTTGTSDGVTLATFEQSAAALTPFFKTCFTIGTEDAGDARKLVNRLRKRALLAEKEMMFATGGASPHKSTVYTLGLLLAGRGRALMSGGDMFLHAASYAKGEPPELYRRFMEKPSQRKESAFALYGVQSERAEAEDGFESTRRAYAQLRYFESRASSENDAAVLTLLYIMCDLPDAGILRRNGQAALFYVQHRAREVCAMPSSERMAAVYELDADLNARGLYPTGAASMLVAALFLRGLDKLDRRA